MNVQINAVLCCYQRLRFCKDCGTKYCSAGLVLVSLWLVFVVLVSLRSYGHIPDPFH